MARSLTVQQEENPRTSLLFFGFLLLAVGWLALASFCSFGSEATDGAVADGAPISVR